MKSRQHQKETVNSSQHLEQCSNYYEKIYFEIQGLNELITVNKQSQFFKTMAIECASLTSKFRELYGRKPAAGLWNLLPHLYPSCVFTQAASSQGWSTVASLSKTRSPSNSWLHSEEASVLWQPYWIFLGLHNGSVVKEFACDAGDTGDVSSIPGTGRSPGGGNGSPAFLPGESHGQRNLMGYKVHGVAKSWT